VAKILDIKYVGKHQTYDLEVDHPDHQFYLANGVLTSNSHAIAYAIDSYYGAWLMTHYETDWLATCLQSENDIEGLAVLFSEIKGMGYEIAPPDVNYSSSTWTWSEELRAFVPPLSSLKGVGDSAVEEILANRPYRSVDDMLWNDDGSWRHSKFNKRALEALIKMNALTSLGLVGEGKVFDNYRQAYHVIVENNDAIKKTLKRDPFAGRKRFYELAQACKDMPDWTLAEKVEHTVQCSGSANVATIVRPELLAKLRDKGVRSIDDWDGKDIYWFLAKSATPKVTKNGKQYLMLEALGPTGKLTRLMCWGWDGKRQLQQYCLCLSEVDKNDFGASTNMWKLREIDLEN